MHYEKFLKDEMTNPPKRGKGDSLSEVHSTKHNGNSKGPPSYADKCGFRVPADTGKGR